MGEYANILFGNRAEWQAFRDRHPVFLERFGHLTDSLNAAFTRKLAETDKLSTMVFFTSQQCVDDFLEILLLCGNGEGSGAEKLLRSAFERVVLVSYLHRHPDKVDDYYDYYHVSTKKVADSAVMTWGKAAVDATRMAAIDKNYDQVRAKYKNRKCSKCGHVETGLAWSPVPLQDMATDVGLGPFTFYAYTLPLLQAHPSVKGTLSHLEGCEDGPIGYRDRIDRKLADRVLSTAHALLLHVLLVQVDRFAVDGLDTLVTCAVSDYQGIWSEDPGVDFR